MTKNVDMEARMAASKLGRKGGLAKKKKYGTAAFKQMARKRWGMGYQVYVFVAGFWEKVELAPTIREREKVLKVWERKGFKAKWEAL